MSDNRAHLKALSCDLSAVVGCQMLASERVEKLDLPMVGACCVGTAKSPESKGTENMASVSGREKAKGRLSEEGNKREGEVGWEGTRETQSLGASVKLKHGFSGTS